MRRSRIAVGQESTTLGNLLDFPSLRLIVIHDAWVGYSDVSPLVRSYVLRPGAKGWLVGEGRLTTGRGLARDAPASAPPARSRKLIEALAGADLREMPYVPFFDHTDDYPHIEIALHAHARDIGRDGGLALLHSTSQGEGWSPWAVSVGGASYVVEGAEIGRAYAAMAKSLERQLPEE